MTVPVFRFSHRLAQLEFHPFSGNNTVLNSRDYPQPYFFSAIDWHLSINACRSASVLKVGRIDCIPPPEQFVEFISGAPSPPPQLIKVALRAIINTRFLELINSSSFKIINNMAWNAGPKCNNSWLPSIAQPRSEEYLIRSSKTPLLCAICVEALYAVPLRPIIYMQSHFPGQCSTGTDPILDRQQ
jgi:hypothetical protein